MHGGAFASPKPILEISGKISGGGANPDCQANYRTITLVQLTDEEAAIEPPHRLRDGGYGKVVTTT